jgi:branched-subunit amino acid transport protein
VNDVWMTVVVLALVTAAIRAAGPVLVGGRELHPRLFGVIALLAPALLAALVVTETFGGPEGSLEADERAAGVAAAGAAIAFRAPILLVIAIAAAVTALLRAMT